MRLVVIIPTVGRRDVLSRAVARLGQQTRLPDAVIVSTTDRQFVPAEWIATHVGADHAPSPFGFPIVCLFGDPGSCHQRNRALDAVLGTAGIGNPPDALQRPLDADDVVTFFDDDFLPAGDYLEIVAREFAANPDWAVLSGRVPFDGAHNQGYTIDEGIRLLESIAPVESGRIAEFEGAYGCNMSIRAGAIGNTRFDERLPLYGWQEDIDFTTQLGKRGRVIWNSALAGVHLGTKAGRVKGVRFGYSQVANPLYLIRKGTMSAGFGIELMLRNIAANTARSVWPESYVDRRGRLYGNIVALTHAVTGRLKPEHILEL